MSTTHHAGGRLFWDMEHHNHNPNLLWLRMRNSGFRPQAVGLVEKNFSRNRWIAAKWNPFSSVVTQENLAEFDTKEEAMAYLLAVLTLEEK